MALLVEDHFLMDNEWIFNVGHYFSEKILCEISKKVSFLSFAVYRSSNMAQLCQKLFIASMKLCKIITY